MASYVGLGFLLFASVTIAAGQGELPIAAFTSNQVWGFDMGQTISHLGLKPMSVYLLRPSSCRPTLLPTPDWCCMYEAELAPQRDRIAYSVIRAGAPRMVDDPSSFYVIVSDTAGRELARFPGARRLRWSPDGSRLALAYAKHDTNWSWTPDRMGIWQRSDGTLERLPHAAADLYWSERDTLFLLVSDRVLALDVTSGRVSETRHHGPDVSPDREYSMRHYTSWASGTTVQEDRDSLELSHCALWHHNAAPLGYYPPFWVRSSGSRHLMCTTIGEGSSVPAGQKGMETGLFDPHTLAILVRFPGKPVVPTPDRGAVVVARGDTFAFEPLTAVREPERGPTVRVRMEATSWGGGVRILAMGSGTRSLGIWKQEVAAGEWISDHLQRGGACDRFFRVARIIDPDHIEVEIPVGQYTVELPGRAKTQGGLTPVSWEPIHLRTNSTDGGYAYDLSITK
jgi:hypothetical protein